MKTKKIMQTKYFILLLSLLSISACKKDENKSLKGDTTQTEEKKVDVKRTVTIPELKAYLSGLIKADTTILGYDEKREVFTLLGIDQFTKEKLTEVYLNNNKN